VKTTRNGVFTHSIASHSLEDVELLRQVLRTLEAGRNISVATNRLYEVCKVFLRFATAFVRSRQDCFGSYNQEDDSFTFPVMEGGAAGQFYDVASGFESGDILESMNGNLVPMSAFLGSYLGENQSLNRLWNLDFAQAGSL
jgi:hypothetical protein